MTRIYHLNQIKEALKDISLTEPISNGFVAYSNLIITTTPAEKPLLTADDIQPGTHITAMGSDTSSKQELSTEIISKSDIVVADSISQCRERGEISKALAKGAIKESRVIELGHLIEHPALAKRTGQSTSVSDLTGVAVQDVQIATAVCDALKIQSEKIKY